MIWYGTNGIKKLLPSMLYVFKITYRFRGIDTGNLPKTRTSLEPNLSIKVFLAFQHQLALMVYCKFANKLNVYCKFAKKSTFLGVVALPIPQWAEVLASIDSS